MFLIAIFIYHIYSKGPLYDITTLVFTYSISIKTIPDPAGKFSLINLTSTFFLIFKCYEKSLWINHVDSSFHDNCYTQVLL